MLAYLCDNHCMFVKFIISMHIKTQFTSIWKKAQLSMDTNWSWQLNMSTGVWCLGSWYICSFFLNASLIHFKILKFQMKKSRVYLHILRSQSLHEKSACCLGCVKKMVIEIRLSVRYILSSVIISFFHKTVWMHIDCQDVHETFFVNFF
jgi:hypothetical protein